MAIERHTGRRVALVGCGKAKLDHEAPARELYTSNLFRLSVAWAERHCDAWYVVSALHGLVEPDELLRPYDFSLADMRVGELEAWTRRVLMRLSDRERAADVVLLAGGRYGALAGHLRWSMHPAVDFCRGTVASVEEPLTGLGIGQRLGWLKRQVSEQAVGC